MRLFRLYIHVSGFFFTCHRSRLSSKGRAPMAKFYSWWTYSCTGCPEHIENVRWKPSDQTTMVASSLFERTFDAYRPRNWRLATPNHIGTSCKYVGVLNDYYSSQNRPRKLSRTSVIDRQKAVVVTYEDIVSTATRSWPNFEPAKVDKDVTTAECGICGEQLKCGELGVLTSCEHYFHAHELTTWQQTRKASQTPFTCPTCRRNFDGE